MSKLKEMVTKVGKRLAGVTIEAATAGVIDADDIFGRDDIEIEEEQLLQLIAIRKHLQLIAKQNEEILAGMHYHGVIPPTNG